MSGAAMPRWALSFADLGLLLIGCFVMLYATESARPKAGVSQVAAPSAERPLGSYDVNALFEPGEARLTPAARTALQAAGRRWAGQPVRVLSAGTAGDNARLDRFELAAARGAAVARALNEGGMAERDIEVRLEGAGGGPQAQVIAITRR